MLPENNKAMCNYFYNFFTPSIQTEYPAYQADLLTGAAV